MYRFAKPSFQSLLIEMQFDGQILSTGTAFIVDTPNEGFHLITNRHNVTGRHQKTGKPLSKTAGVPSHIVIHHNRKSALGSWLPKIEPLFIGETPRWIEHPNLGSRADFVALKCTELDDVDLFPYDVRNSGPQIAVGPAEPVSVVGFPFGVTAGGSLGVWATGFVASELAVNFAGLPVLLIDCRSRQGQSGSPVIAYRHGGAVAMEDGSSKFFTGPVTKLIGIYSSRIRPESDLGMVWKAEAVAELVGTL